MSSHANDHARDWSYHRVAYLAALEKPDTFKRSRAVGAWLCLTPRRFQSGEVDYDGHISRRGDGQLRALLYEAAAVLLTRVRMKARFAVGASCCGNGLASNAPLPRWLAQKTSTWNPLSGECPDAGSPSYPLAIPSDTLMQRIV